MKLVILAVKVIAHQDKYRLKLNLKVDERWIFKWILFIQQKKPHTSQSL